MPKEVAKSDLAAKPERVKGDRMAEATKNKSKNLSRHPADVLLRASARYLASRSVGASIIPIGPPTLRGMSEFYLMIKIIGRKPTKAEPPVKARRPR